MLVVVHDYSFTSIMDQNCVVEILDSGVVILEGGGSFSGTLDDIPDGVNRIAMAPAERTKLAGISAGATVNSTDAFLLNRTNHTGTQTALTISNFSTSVDARITAQKGAANGLAPLGADTKISTAYLPAAVLGGLNYQGVWNASTNSPTLASGVGTKGYYYKVSVAGSTNIDGETDWKVGDWITFNGTTWDKIDNTENVTAVNGMTGNVTITTITGNSGTATKLATARNINGTAFDGTADITVAVDKVNGNKYTVSTVAPVSPATGDVWIDTN